MSLRPADKPCKPAQTVTHIATMWPSPEQQQLWQSPEQRPGYPGALGVPGGLAGGSFLLPPLNPVERFCQFWFSLATCDSMYLR